MNVLDVDYKKYRIPVSAEHKAHHKAKELKLQAEIIRSNKRLYFGKVLAELQMAVWENKENGVIDVELEDLLWRVTLEVARLSQPLRNY